MGSTFTTGQIVKLYALEKQRIERGGSGILTEVQEFIRRLESGGAGSDTRATPDRHRIVPLRPRLIRGTFTPPDAQLAQARKWKAKRPDWADVPEAWFDKLGPAPAWPTERFGCVVLDLALPDLPERKDAEGDMIPAIPGYIRTVQHLWRIISFQHPKRHHEQFFFDAKHLSLLDGATYEPGLRWRVLDLGANWDKVDGIASATVRNPITSPNVDGFAALAHHPKFVCKMDGVRVPFIWIPGFQVTVLGGDPRRNVPIVYFYRLEQRVFVDAGWDGNQDSHYSVPSRLGVRN